MIHSFCGQRVVSGTVQYLSPGKSWREKTDKSSENLFHFHKLNVLWYSLCTVPMTQTKLPSGLRNLISGCCKRSAVCYKVKFCRGLITDVRFITRLKLRTNRDTVIEQ